MFWILSVLKKTKQKTKPLPSCLFKRKQELVFVSSCFVQLLLPSFLAGFFGHLCVLYPVRMALNGGDKCVYFGN